jgi:hypothetical protein
LRRRAFAGVIGALGESRRSEVIPYLVDALAEDECRIAAERALRKFARSARPALLQTARRLRLPSAETESVSSVRRRRSALRLLAEMGVPRQLLPDVRPLMHDRDQRISALACKILLASLSAHDCRQATLRLEELLPGADWMLTNEIEDCLAKHWSR